MSPTAVRYTFEKKKQKNFYRYKISGLHKGSIKAVMHGNGC